MHDLAHSQHTSSLADQSKELRFTKIEYAPLLYIVQNMRAADRLECFATQWHDSDELFAEHVMETLKNGGVGFVAWRGQEPVAALGATPLWPGVVSVWMFATDSFSKIGLGVTKWVRRHMVPSLAKSGIHRGQCFSMDGHTSAQTWLESVGAVEEAVISDFGRNRETFRMYAWSERLGNLSVEKSRSRKSRRNISMDGQTDRR